MLSSVPKNFRGVMIATNPDQIMACIALRGSVFLAMGEPFNQEIDGFDYCGATHLLYVENRRSLATMRIRFLHGTSCAWERVAVALHADAQCLNDLIGSARDYCQRKGMTEAIATINNAGLQKFLEKKGAYFRDEDPLEFAGRLYSPMVVPLTPTLRPDGSLEVIKEAVYLQNASSAAPPSSTR